MTKKINKIIKEYTSFSNGELAISGGPFGYGNTNQLAAKSLNPATKKIADQTDAENNKNSADLQHSLGRYKTPLQQDNGTGMQSYDVGPSPTKQSRNQTDMFAPAPHGPGNIPVNTLISPQNFVPTEDSKDTEPYLIDDMTNDVMLKIF
jgi:hypothetical protein